MTFSIVDRIDGGFDGHSFQQQQQQPFNHPSLNPPTHNTKKRKQSHCQNASKYRKIQSQAIPTSASGKRSSHDTLPSTNIIPSESPLSFSLASFSAIARKPKPQYDDISAPPSSPISMRIYDEDEEISLGTHMDLIYEHTKSPSESFDLPMSPYTTNGQESQDISYASPISKNSMSSQNHFGQMSNLQEHLFKVHNKIQLVSTSDNLIISNSMENFPRNSPGCPDVQQWRNCSMPDIFFRNGSPRVNGINSPINTPHYPLSSQTQSDDPHFLTQLFNAKYAENMARYYSSQSEDFQNYSHFSPSLTHSADFSFGNDLGRINDAYHIGSSGNAAPVPY